jgi:cation-transporting P-type ATPase E
MPSITGLTTLEIAQRTKAGHVNISGQAEGRSYLGIILQNVFNFINIVLFGIGLLLVLIDRTSDALVYVSVLLLNSLIGTVQEIRAKIQLDKISLLTKPHVTVIRNGVVQKIQIKALVIDDILKLSAGDLIPVDALILEGVSQIDESLLTGESDLITKIAGQSISSGTFVISGICTAKVTQVGAKTIANQITDGSRAYKKVLTPLQKEVNLSIRVLMVLAFVFALLAIINAFFNQIPFEDSLPITAVIAGIIPNSLFVMISLAYAIGGIVLLRFGALAQQLNAIESISNVDILCIDKTGTLTTNKIILEKIIPIDTTLQNVKSILTQFVSNSTTTTQTLEALYLFKKDKNLDLIQEIAFSSEYKWSGFSFKNKKVQGTYILSAPEIAIDPANLPNTSFYKSLTIAQNKGLRVLLLSVSLQVLPLKAKNKPQIPPGMVPSALIIFKNELRKDVQTTLDQFKQSGVEIKIISGDNTSTVHSLAKQAGIFNDQTQIISGPELAKLEPDPFKLDKIISETSIFGRITPKQKEMIITTLKAQGKYVAMIGDGVNDALSIKKANLGIAMESGSQVTRNIADILLLKDSFTSLPRGLQEGQKIRNAIENVFNIYFSRVLYLLLIIISVSISGLPFPFTVKQNALISVVTAGIPAIWLTAFSNYGKPSKKKLTLSSLEFVIPAGFSLAVFSLFIYIGYGYFGYLTHNQDHQTIIKFLNKFTPHMRTVLTCFLIVSGLILNIFVSAPNQLLSLSKKVTANWYSTYFSMSSIFLFILVIQSPHFRSFWDLSRLSTLDLAIVFFSSLAWAISLKLITSYRLLSKLIEIKS